MCHFGWDPEGAGRGLGRWEGLELLGEAGGEWLWGTCRWGFDVVMGEERVGLVYLAAPISQPQSWVPGSLQQTRQCCFPGNISDLDECFEDDKKVGFRKGLGVFN